MRQVDELVQQARSALASGDRLVARGYWRRASRIAPERLDIWLDLLALTDTPDERKRCLTQIIALDPDNADAVDELHRIQAAERAEAEAARAAAQAALEQPADATNQKSRPALTRRPDVSDEMRLQWDRDIADGKTLHCINHAQRETVLRCNSCGAPICVRCAVRTPVGLRCQECVKAQQAHFYNAEWYDYPIAAIVTLFLSVPAAVVSGLIASWWFALVIGPLVGGMIGGAVHQAVRRRRGRWTWVVVGACMLIGAMVALATTFRLVEVGIYGVLATGAAVSVLRFNKSR